MAAEPSTPAVSAAPVADTGGADSGSRSPAHGEQRTDADPGDKNAAEEKTLGPAKQAGEEEAAGPAGEPGGEDTLGPPGSEDKQGHQGKHENPSDAAKPVEHLPTDDGWDYWWDSEHHAHVFYNRFTGLYSWNNPRMPTTGYTAPCTTPYVASYMAPGTGTYASNAFAAGTDSAASAAKAPHGGYNPAIHGSYNPKADYAVRAREQQEQEEAAATAATAAAYAASGPPAGVSYTATAHFNKQTGEFQDASVRPENYSDEARANRQMNAFFDVDAAANSHDGRSLKAERQARKLSRREVEEYKRRNRERKEKKRRAWLLD